MTAARYAGRPTGGLAAGVLTLIAVLVGPTPAPAQTASDPFAHYCPANAPTTIFLIDQTEVFDDVDKTRFAEGAIAVMNGLWAGERLDIFTVDNQPGNMTPRLSLCIPGCPDEYDRTTPIWQQTCDRVVIERDKRGFQAIYKKIAQDYLFSGKTAPGTELLRTMSQLSSEFQGRPLRKLVIFSDMLEYSSLNKSISFFQEKDIAPLLKAAEKQAPLTDAFKGVPVEAFGLGKWLGQEDKEKKLDLPFGASQAIRQFWEVYFRDFAGASSVRITLNYSN